MSTPTLSIYGCGGAGVNLVKDFVNIPFNPDVPYFPKSSKYALDTSDSNIRTLPEDVTHFLIPGLRGAGKKRQQAFRGVEDHIVDILNNHKPSDFNLVIFSASGGSGSVIGPLTVAELLRRGSTVVCVVVGSTSSGIEAKNTLRTLETLQAMSMGKATGGRPIMMVYQENTTSTNSQGEGYLGSRPVIDSRVEEIVRQLGLLFCGSHHELDHADLVNWLDHSRNHPDIPSQLIEILPFKQSFGGTPEWQEADINALDGAVISIASLLNNDGDEMPSLGQPYSCAGYYDGSVWGGKELPNFHFVTTASRIGRIMGGVELAVRGYDSVQEGLASAAPSGAHHVINKGDRVTDDSGMVF